jgi:hypothetical protein
LVNGFLFAFPCAAFPLAGNESLRTQNVYPRAGPDGSVVRRRPDLTLVGGVVGERRVCYLEAEDAGGVVAEHVVPREAWKTAVVS